MTETMHAVLLTGHGGLDKLVYHEDVAKPVAGPGEVLIRVKACGLKGQRRLTLLRCAPDMWGMVTKPLARTDIPLIDSGVPASDVPALGIDVDRKALVAPITDFHNPLP